MQEKKPQSAILKAFKKLYPNPRSELDFKNPYQLAIAVMLSAQCTDKKVNQVTPELFDTYPDFKSLSRAKLADIEKIIRPINYYRTKSKNLIATAQRVIDQFAGELPLNREDVTSLPGIGQKTANVVLGELGIEQTLPVDTHVFRVAHRLGWAKAKTPGAVEEQLKIQFPKEIWRNLHHWLIFHGRRVCRAQRPLCAECTLAQYCPSRHK